MGDVLKDLRHRLVDGFNPVSQGKLINNLLVWLFKVNFPALFSLRVGQPNFTTVLLAQVVEEVLVKTRVLCVIGGDLQMKGVKLGDLTRRIINNYFLLSAMPQLVQSSSVNIAKCGANY